MHENAVAWKELVMTIVAWAISRTNSSGPASVILYWA